MASTRFNIRNSSVRRNKPFILFIGDLVLRISSDVLTPSQIFVVFVTIDQAFFQ